MKGLPAVQHGMALLFVGALVVDLGDIQSLWRRESSCGQMAEARYESLHFGLMVADTPL
jgi:hypothetical protein